MADLSDLDGLDDIDPFEIDHQLAHLFKHDTLGVDDIYGYGKSIRCSTRPFRQPIGSRSLSWTATS